jgi:peptidoglycan/LPS O-acetylase OafA/YrhL
MPPPRIGTIDALRGLASFSVAWFHFTQGIPNFLPDGPLKASGAYGWLGVQMFFVISGFVIPYALYNAGYERRNFARFLAKRVTRLDPPYLISIVLALVIAYKVPQYLFFGAPLASPGITMTQVMAHFGYLNSIIGKPWLIPVYWSLGIEFQFYLTIGLIFPVLVAKRLQTRLLCAAILMVPSLAFHQTSLLFVHLPIFVIGITTFQTKIGLTSHKVWAAVVLVASGVICLTSGIPASIVAVLCAISILYLELRSRVLCWLGGVSYSLYLVHGPVGGSLLIKISPFTHNTASRGLAVLFATAASITFAYILYRMVELPSQRLSSRLSYGHASPQRLPTAALEVAAGN